MSAGGKGKALAYEQILTALFEYERYCRVKLREVEGGEFMEDYLAKVTERGHEASLSIRKATALGTFVFGAKAAQRLEELQRQMDDPKHNLDIYEIVSSDLASVQSALADLRQLSRQDLLLPKVNRT